VRSYGQYCAVARALDVVGDRWSLLIVRELRLRGSSRYSDLRDGLPGIATNLLADRLRTLEEAGVVRRIDAGPPFATALYELTPWGAQLDPVLQGLGIWGARLMALGQGDDAFQSHWLGFPLTWLADRTPAAPPVTLEIRTGDGPMTLKIGGTVAPHRGAAERPDAVLEGSAEGIVRVLLGGYAPGSTGVDAELTGDRAVLDRLQPPVLSAATPDDPGPKAR
jgi:DNA-binding HxlR family transcriptional regulator